MRTPSDQAASFHTLLTMTATSLQGNLPLKSQTPHHAAVRVLLGLRGDRATLQLLQAQTLTREPRGSRARICPGTEGSCAGTGLALGSASLSFWVNGYLDRPGMAEGEGAPTHWARG